MFGRLKVVNDTSGLSHELQIGKAAEHIACADLILQGFNAFMSDAGLPYDILVDTGVKVFRVQVKGTLKPFFHPTRTDKPKTYRFGLRVGRHYRRVTVGSIDTFAFVALDTRRVAYLCAEDLITKEGIMSGIVEFSDETDVKRWGTRTFQKCLKFPVNAPDRLTKVCFHCNVSYLATKEFFTLNNRCRDGISGICKDCTRTAGTQYARDRRDRRKLSL